MDKKAKEKKRKRQMDLASVEYKLGADSVIGKPGN